MEPGSRSLRPDNRQTHLDIEDLERTPVHLPGAGDVRVNVALQIDAFSGQRIVWLSRDELETFSAQLRNLFDGLSDGASLQAMSPDEFCLEVVTKNSRRHWRARVRLSAHVHGDDATTLAGAIDIDSEYQSEILNGFRSLATTA